MITSKPFSRNFWHLPKRTRKNRFLLLTDVKWLHTYYRHIILLLQVHRWMHQSVIDEKEKAKGTQNLADTHFQIKQNHFLSANFSQLFT